MKKTTTLLLIIFLGISHLSLAQCPDKSPKPNWKDSYQANGFCWCESQYDHGLNKKTLKINGQDYNIKKVCDALKNHPDYRKFKNGDPVYNDIQCGNGPANNADDEKCCPGRVDQGDAGCQKIGPTFDMEWLSCQPEFGGNGNCNGSGKDINDITSLTATAQNCSTVVLNWTDNSTGESGFRIRRKLPSDTKYTNLTDVPAGTESYTDNSAVASKTYIYMVRPLDNGTAVKISNTPQVTTPGCGGQNQAPVANAGVDQTVTDSDNNGSEIVSLDGSASSDADGTISSYVWTEDDNQIATGAAPNVTLATGNHNITLTVTDNDGASDTDNVSVTVKSGGVIGIPVPGIVEAEDFDAGAYFDTDAANKGNAGIRTNEGVDIDNKNGVICIGWCAAGEWTEYTINVAEAGDYSLKYSFSTNKNTKSKSFSFALNGNSIGTVNIAGNDPINGSGNTVFDTRELGTVTLSSGMHTLRWTAGSGAICFDKVEFELLGAVDPIAPSIPTGLTISNIGESTFDADWNASTDNLGVAGYRVYGNTALLADVPGTSANISGLACGESYIIAVSAYDAAGNESETSDIKVVGTDVCSVNDYIYLGHVASGKRLGATTGSVDTRSASNTGSNVQWMVEFASGTCFYLINSGTGQKLNAPTNKTINMVDASSTDESTLWKWVDQGNGEYFIQSCLIGKFFHIGADGSSNISLKWNQNLAGIVWTVEDVAKSSSASNESLTAEIYPNPARTELNILVSNNESVTYQLVSLIGATVAQGAIYSGSETVDVSMLNEGMYVLRIKQGSKVLIEKINIKR